MNVSTSPSVNQIVHDGFTFGVSSACPLDGSQIRALIAMMKSGTSCSLSPLGGRNCIAMATIDRIGRVVMKKYSRGGLLRYFLSSRYVRLGPVRARHEFEVLSKVRAQGVRAPEPLAYAYKGGLFYEAWLFTRELEGTKTVAELAVQEEDRVRGAFDVISDEIIKLIRQRLFHVDLHPGNVLLDQNNRAYLLDFDKASSFKGKLNYLRDRYLCRWRRAVIKHSLPEYLTELMSHGLRRSFDE